ncbi:porin [Alloyangia pacifica]|uniref:Outer membrane protein OmpU n=1 Tax=Alloyangia pacifica TaxID=311180 RepID=A0A1I6U9K1_9RHOB|nr:porin [Alloyangia pacifica]SDH43576.1 outer membrane protein OmpU [Alloyangia pacifica]SFS98146.1 outer membrane protein OmpU [Alloyangia pacifica]
MKKILFASTALVATAGVAAAEVTLTGMAEMGVYAGYENETQFFTDIDVTFTMSGEADNGLVFGANVDLDESDGDPSGAFGPATQGGEAIFVSYGGLTLTMGDTDGALDARVPELALAGGSLADDETSHLGFNHSDGISDLDDIEGTVGLSLDGFGDGQIARVDYAISDFTISASAEQIDDGNEVEDIGDTIWALGVSWNGELAAIDMTAGLGYQTVSDAASVTSVAVTGGFANGLSLGATYSNMDIDGVDDDLQHYGVGFGYEMNALAIGVNWGQYDLGDDELSGWGVAASYDLGGGLEARFGYGWSDVDFTNADDESVSEDDNTWSLGLRMNF